ncbi:MULTISPECIES: hypothetical protein [Pseudomonas]|jgi:hypothetical protein|uniref:Uncharacterized protein n=1 Tax=Pseudomonas phytophila TaxID=2867264 RepID=A0ABY6FKG0_9PSED|nr:MULTISPECIES: hypothetical protein [Pseudomonas]MCD5991436.1 hypothetical protein [Pseudomonas quasicaspiana]MDU8360325.1 hypothetical protein [Pseudomonas syringae group sp. J309-1]UXZ98456.1 hypothetical protein K3169_11585 [Pseudomonas phytophila]
MSRDPVDSQAAQTPGPNPNPSESDGRSTSDNDVREADINEVEPDDPDVAGDDASDSPS